MWLAGILFGGLVVLNIPTAIDPYAYMTDTLTRILWTINIVAAGLILILIGRGLRYDDQPRDVGRIILITGVVAITSSLIVLWWDLRWSQPLFDLSTRLRDYVFGTMLTSTILTVVLVQNFLMCAMYCPNPFLRGARVLALVLAWILTVTLISLCWFFHAVLYLLPGPMHEGFFAGLVGLASITVLATGLVPLMCRIQRRRIARQSSVVGQVWSLEMDCPRCAAASTWKRGMNRCRTCGYGLRVAIEEPRCACGYLLYALTREHCPECGADVPETARWRPPDNAPAISKHSAIAADGQ